MGQFELFGALLRRLLAERGWNPSDLARALGTHRSAVNRWVNGDNLPDRERVPQIADILMLTNEQRSELFRVWFNG